MGDSLPVVSQDGRYATIPSPVIAHQFGGRTRPGGRREGMPCQKVKLVIDYSVRNLCSQAYPLHPKGCLNFGKKATCPPKARLIENIIDITQPIYAVWNVFDFGTHVQKMIAAHPDWSRRQRECCLYWQGGARKKLQDEIGFWSISGNWNHSITCPEACGVNITETMKSIGEILEWPPTTKAYQVAICGALIRERDRVT